MLWLTFKAIRWKYGPAELQTFLFVPTEVRQQAYQAANSLDVLIQNRNSNRFKGLSGIGFDYWECLAGFLSFWICKDTHFIASLLSLFNFRLQKYNHPIAVYEFLEQKKHKKKHEVKFHIGYYPIKNLFSAQGKFVGCLARKFSLV